MKYHTPPSDRDPSRMLDLIVNGTSIANHHDLLRWLQGDLQYYLPHDILLAGWGDFAEGNVQHDILSRLGGARSYSVGTEALPFLFGKLHERWIASSGEPVRVNVREYDYLLGSTRLPGSFVGAMSTMRSALVHGLRDERSKQECLYVLLSTADIPPASGPTALSVLLPHIDAALRKIKQLPKQRMQCAPLARSGHDEVFGLSGREAQIMDWVAMGKTNSEIGSILSISGFTVKNHMQRIFQKLNVFNRAQAVSKVIRVTLND